jgi:hypothetical protein
MAGTFSNLNNQPSFNADTMLLLTDGSVMCHELLTNKWHRLKPDSSGSYTNGTWSSLASMPDDSNIPSSQSGPTYAPLYYASAVLADGTVFIAGGEYNVVGGAAADVAEVQLYNPLTDSWQILPVPTGFSGGIGDAISCVLPDGRLLLGQFNGSSTAIYDPALQLWTTGGTKGDSASEESFTLLPNNTILSVQCSNIPNAEKYIIATNQWVSAGSTPSTLPQACTGFVPEIGAGVLLPNGNVFCIGATGNTAIYTPPATVTGTDTWTAGPTLTDGSGNTSFPMDAGAVLLPNGKVLCVGSPSPPCNYPGPSTFFEYDPATNLASVITGPSNNGSAAFTGRFLLLPNGQVLFSNHSSTITIYTPDGAPDASWKPAITNISAQLVQGHTYILTGTQLNGLSQACMYGDDAQMATNYPIVQLTNTASGDVVYLRTSNHSTMAVATGSTPQTTNVFVPMDTPPGNYHLVVIANGIASDPVTVDVASQDIFFIVDRSTFGQGEIQALINLNGNPAVIDPVLYIVAEGFTPADLGLNAGNLSSPPVLPAIPDPVTNLSFVFSGAVVPENAALPPIPQRFTFPFKAVFQDASMFGFGPTIEPLVLTANLSAAGTAVTANATIELIKNPNPFILHGDVAHGYPWYLSVDIRVFQMKQGQRKFAVSVGTGSARDVATSFITQVMNNLNGSPGSAGGEFDALPEGEDNSTLALAPTDTGGTPVYNFALARVRYRDIIPASNVRLFFRMFPAQQTNATYNASTTYRTSVNGSGQKIPLLGVQGDEIMTIPFFATPRIDTNTVSMNTQTDAPNVRPTINPDTLGGEVDTYFGCWLDINQPGDLLFPSRMVGGVPANIPDGPFTGMGTLFPIQQLVRSQHQCLLAEISFDPDPIPATADPSISDKLAQRNLTFVNVPNPGLPDSRRAPQPFEIRPTPATLPATLRHDEMMILWGNLPSGSYANIYLPAVVANEVLLLANQMYTTHQLTKTDANTLQCPARGITYIPIPKSAGPNFAGLLTIDLPPTVRKGEKYAVIVKQITSSVGFNRRIEVNLAEVNASANERFFTWQRVLGVFQLTIPVSMRSILLPPEQRLLSVLRWIQIAIPVSNRWYPVFVRYVQQIADRVKYMGGEPTIVVADPNGNWKRHCHRWGKWYCTCYRRQMRKAAYSFCCTSVAVAVALLILRKKRHKEK